MKEKFDEGKLEQYLTEDILHKIIDILIKMLRERHQAYTTINTLGWFKILFDFFKSQVERGPTRGNQKMFFKRLIVEHFDEILEQILGLMSNQDEEVRKAALAANDMLMSNIQLVNKEMKINFVKVMPLLKEMLSKSTSSTSSSISTSTS
jgi:oligoendopeptidase F